MKLFKTTTLATILLAASSTVALSQSSFWTGTWDTEHGELRLKENGSFVYGDYGDVGIIEGVKVSTARGETLRVRFTRDNGSFGYTEWAESGDDGNRFTGRWVWKGKPMPTWNDQSIARWRGTRTNDSVPSLTKYTGDGRGAAMQANASREYRRWVNAVDMNADDPWQGTWDTDFGPVRLRTFAGRYVYGDYGDHGTINGVWQRVGSDHILRARYTRNDDGSTGYLEWKSDGKNDHTADGRWNIEQRALPKWNSNGSSWGGTRTNAAPPTLRVHNGSYGQQAIIGSNLKFVDWVKFTAPKKPVTKKSAKAIGQANRLSVGENLLTSKFPSLKDAPAGFTPRYIEVSLSKLESDDGFIENLSLTDLNTEFYGLIGIYLSCDTTRGARAITPFGNRANRVWNVARADAVKVKAVDGYYFPNMAKLRFPIDQACLNSSDGRFALQMQTNLKEKDSVPRLDDDYGYRAGRGYLDDITSAFAGQGKTYFVLSDAFTNVPPGNLTLVYKETLDRHFKITAKVAFVE